jgi:hypothetical protein
MEGSMINQMAMRLWDAGLAMPSLSCLIDRLLDRIEQFRDALVPTEAGRLSCAEAPAERPFDQFTG